MNFDCVGVNSRGMYYMKFHEPFNIVNRIRLLQRWILVHSFIYYELNENVASDFRYDANVRQLEELVKLHPEEATRSKYYKYFDDFFDTNEHSTTGFDLLERVRINDGDLYKLLNIDANLALKRKRGGGNI